MKRMNVGDPNILSLRQNVEAAAQEFDMAVKFHETWKPTVHDTIYVGAWGRPTPRIR
jgi:hypothetical protein